ncbi:unnamed protein product [Musa hybrid cultivar]
MGHTLLTDYYPTKLGEAVVPPAAAIPPLPSRNESSKTSNRWPVGFSTRSTATVAMLLWMHGLWMQLYPLDFRHCQANSCMDHVDAWPSPTAMQSSSHGISVLGVPDPPWFTARPLYRVLVVYSGHVRMPRA